MIDRRTSKEDEHPDSVTHGLLKCPVCECDSTYAWFTKNQFEHRRCPICGHGYVCPLPAQSEIDAYYRSLNDGLSSDFSWQAEAGHKRGLWKKLLRRSKYDSGIGPLLDLGCGGGQFLRLAFEQGWDNLCGVEPSPKAAELARKVSMAPIYEGTWKEVPLKSEAFAAIALFDVLEHDADPHGLLLHCFELLRPGGSLMITVPNVQGLSMRCFGQGAYVVIPPEHLSYFTAKSIRIMLIRTGFLDPYTFTCDLYLKEWLRAFARNESGKSVAEFESRQKTHYMKWHQRFSGGIALTGIAAVNQVLKVVGYGDQLVAFARKPLESTNHD